MDCSRLQRASMCHAVISYIMSCIVFIYITEFSIVLWRVDFQNDWWIVYATIALWNWTSVTRERFIKCFFFCSSIYLHFLALYRILYSFLNQVVGKKMNTNQLPMPTWPPFSSVGVPGPLAGRESAPSVAL